MDNKTLSQLENQHKENDDETVKKMEETSLILNDQEHRESHVDQAREISNELQSKSNPKMNFLKKIFFSSLIVEFIILAVCLALSITDIITDILLSIEYFNGFDHNCLTVYSNLTTDAKSSIVRPAHPGWFYLTLFFIVLPCVVRILTIKTEDFLQNYFSCFDIRNGFHQQKLVTKFLLKLLCIPILPVLVIINQFRQFPLLLKIHREKERLDGSSSRETGKHSTKFKTKIKKTFQQP